MDDQSRPPAKPITAMKARQHFWQLLEQVYYRGEQYIIERAGKPMAALIPLPLLDELLKNSSQADAEHNVQKGNKRQARKRKA